MPKRIVNNLERVLIIAVMWLLIELNPIVSQNLELQRVVGKQEAMTSSSLNSYKSPITRIVFSLAAEQHQQQLNQNSSDSSSSSKFINEQSRLFKRLLQQTTTTTATRKTSRTKPLATTKQTLTTTTRRKYLENELMMASNTKINDHDDEEDEYYSEDYSEANSSGESRQHQQQQSNEVVNNRCRPKPIEMSLDLRSCGRVTLPTTECRGYCPSSEQMLASKLKKQTCWACKPHRYVYKNYKIRCMDNSIMNLRLKTIDACSCFKHSEKIIPL